MPNINTTTTNLDGNEWVQVYTLGANGQLQPRYMKLTNLSNSLDVVAGNATAAFGTDVNTEYNVGNILDSGTLKDLYYIKFEIVGAGAQSRSVPFVSTPTNLVQVNLYAVTDDSGDVVFGPSLNTGNLPNAEYWVASANSKNPGFNVEDLGTDSGKIFRAEVYYTID